MWAFVLENNCKVELCITFIERLNCSLSNKKKKCIVDCKGTGEGQSHYLTLLKAARSGDWKSAKNFIDSNPNALTARITKVGLQTVFHVAAESCKWTIILELLEIVSPESLAVQDADGNTVLHYVAHSGSLKIAKALLKKNYNLLEIVNDKGQLPLFCSILSESKELVLYFTLETRVDDQSALLKILEILIESGYVGKNRQ
ncbi:hypothetical protein JRO89_XS09G0214900 [Xanthoceras sorbifolium]|uniref:Ankyrin repeat protein n=1 Tax=Xanthoceras sorbifolium TaxID=99658 RepID=A0ABQ8HMB2_9ROSI|nr:hypothetical protein JRO89_XS09G0214900 [Xanthoceras sorbifolium]